MTDGQPQTRASRHGLTLLEVVMVLAIVMILSAIAIPGFSAALLSSHRTALVADANRLYLAFMEYQVDHRVFPATSMPQERALDLKTLAPLSRGSYFQGVESLTRKLLGGQLTAYDSPDVEAADTQFWAVLTLAYDPSVVVLVASTNQFPGHDGTWLEGLYYVQGGEIVPIRLDD